MEDNKKLRDESEAAVSFDEGDTPIEESQRETGSDIETDAKPSAKAESGEGSAVVAGSPNQGTESR